MNEEIECFDLVLSNFSTIAKAVLNGILNRLFFLYNLNPKTDFIASKFTFPRSISP